MKKNRTYGLMEHIGLLKMIKIMRFTIFILFLSLSQTFAVDTYSQQTKLSFDLKNIKVEEVLDKIEKSSEFFFMYNKNMVDVERKIDIQVEGKEINQILDKIFENTGISYSIKDRQILLINNSILSTNVGFNFQQQKSVSGKVTDSSGLPLPGVSVVEKGTANGTITDITGNYTITKVLPNSVLVFSFVGMKSQEIAVENSSVINIKMIDETFNVEEVIAVGYTKQRKVDVTSAITTINTKELGSITSSNIGQALQGRSPGLFIKDNGYNQGLSFLIRGQTTIGNNGPLVIVDGIPYNSYNVDPGNIDNITVLKDASATSIYGARASSGVILITTKTGNKAKISVNCESYFSWGNPVVLPKSANSIQSAELMNTAATNSGASQLFTQEQINLFKSGTNPDYPDNNWLKLLLKTEGKQKHYVSVNGGSERTQYMLALSYLKSNGIFLKNDNDNQYNLLLNISSKLRENIDLKISTSVNRTNSLRPSINGGMDNIYQHALVVAPFLAIKDQSTGNYAAFNKAGSYSRGFWNPLWELEAGKSISQNDVFLINSDLTWELLKGLKYIGRAAITTTYGNNTSNLYSRGYTGGPSWVSETASLSKSVNQTERLNFQNFLHYEKKNNKHSISALAGWDLEFYKESNFSAGRQKFQFDKLLTELSSPNSGDKKDITGLSSNTYKSALQSAVGRVNYSFAEKYLVQFSARYDGSSNFAPETRYGFFPAVSLGWLLSKEGFFKLENFDNFKLRASYGTSGNNNVSGSYLSFMSFGTYYFDNSSVGSTASEGSPSFRNLKWEKTTTFNTGIDFSIYKGLFSGSFDFYNKRTDDILLPSPIAGTVGTNRNGPAINAGSVRNSGIEILLTHERSIRSFNYNVSFNLSYNKSKIVSLTSAFSPYSTSYRVGDELGVTYGYISQGIFRTNQEASEYLLKVKQGMSAQTSAGDIGYKDINQDGIIDYKDVVPIAKTLPKILYGSNIGLGWKNFDFQLFLQGVAKVQGYYSNDMFGNSSWIPQEALSSWSKDNPNGNYPKPLLYGTKTYFQNFGTTSSFWAFNAAYLRIKKLELGYKVVLPSKNVIQSLRLYLSGTNLFTIDHYRDGFDPESPSFAAIPSLRTYSIGLNVKF